MKNRHWIAFSCILGAFAGLMLTILDGASAFLFWMVYCVLCAVVINTPKELKGLRLVLASMASPLALGAAILFRIHLQGASFISGVGVSGGPVDHVLTAAICVGSIFGIWIFSEARPVVLFLLKKIFDFRDGEAEAIVRRLKWVLQVVGILILLGATVLGLRAPEVLSQGLIAYPLGSSSTQGPDASPRR